MKLLINGEERELHVAANVTEMISELALPAPSLLVEHNGVALRRDEWAARTLNEGDRIEIISIVAGG